MTRGAAGALFWRWGPAALYAANIWVLSSFPGGPKLPVNAYVAHSLGFGALGALLWLALNRPTRSPWRAAVLAAVLAGAWGIVDELHQSRVPRRTADPFDVLADFGGAAAVAFSMAAVASVGRARGRPERDGLRTRPFRA